MKTDSDVNNSKGSKVHHPQPFLFLSLLSLSLLTNILPEDSITERERDKPHVFLFSFFVFSFTGVG